MNLNKFHPNSNIPKRCECNGIAYGVIRDQAISLRCRSMSAMHLIATIRRLNSFVG